MKKNILLVIFTIVLLFAGSITYCARLPIDMSIEDWENNGGTKFGEKPFTGAYADQIHLGVDIGAPAGTTWVRAIADGVVKYKRNYVGPLNYGGIYIVEHNIEGEIVCAVYSHLDYGSFTKGEGQQVKEGDPLGIIGTKEQNGGWDYEHLHFGIRPGVYRLPWDYISVHDPETGWRNEWVYLGYTLNANEGANNHDLPYLYSHEDMRDHWYNPTQFIQQHLIGFNLHDSIQVVRYWGRTMCYDNDLYLGSTGPWTTPYDWNIGYREGDFRSTYRIINTGSQTVFIDHLVLSVYESNGDFVRYMNEIGSTSPKYVHDLNMEAGDEYKFDEAWTSFNHDEIREYRIVAEAFIGGERYQLQTKDYLSLDKDQVGVKLTVTDFPMVLKTFLSPDQNADGLWAIKAADASGETGRFEAAYELHNISSGPVHIAELSLAAVKEAIYKNMKIPGTDQYTITDIDIAPGGSLRFPPPQTQGILSDSNRQDGESLNEINITSDMAYYDFSQGETGDYKVIPKIIFNGQAYNMGYQDLKVINTHNVTSIKITGWSIVSENSGTQYTCTAYHTDGSTTNVTGFASWTLEGAINASINNSGYLTTHEITANDDCRIRASYGGMYDLFNVTIENSGSNLQAPYNLTASKGAYTDQIVINWSIAPNTDKVSIDRKRDDESWIGLGWTNTLASYTDTDSLQTGSIYYYRVRAHNTATGDVSVYSNEDSGFLKEPGADEKTPQNVNATNDHAHYIQLTCDWTANIEGWKVYRSESPNGTYALIETYDNNQGFVYNDYSPEPGIYYYYKLTSYGSFGESPPSSPVGGSKLLYIGGISPTGGSPGDTVTIINSEYPPEYPFGLGANQGTVYFGSIPATVISWSNEQVTATVPEGSGTVGVTVSSPAGIPGTNSKTFTYDSPPTLANIGITGPEEVEENSGAQYNCTAYYSDGSSSNVNGTATWGVDNTYAVINNSGYLTTSSIPSDQSCRISVSYTDENVTKSTYQDITIFKPKITVITPNGGESFEVGSTLIISWETAGTVDYVKIEYSTDNGSNWVTETDSVINENNYEWIVPGNPSHNCLVRISNASGGGPSDQSNAAFSIVTGSSTGSFERVSINSDGITQGDGPSQYPSISGDGRYVAFASNAGTLVNEGGNGSYQVFVHDRDTGETELVSRALDGGLGNGTSNNPSISSDGRYVAFHSSSSNLVTGYGSNHGNYHIFFYDRQSNQTTLVTVSLSGVYASYNSLYPMISPDGNYIVFESEANDLVSGDTNPQADIFCYNKTTKQITQISSPKNAGTWQISTHSSITSGGRYVAFMSNIKYVPAVTNDRQHIYAYDRQTNQFKLISVSSDGTQADQDSSSPFISSDGNYVAFYSSAAALVPEGGNGNFQVFLRNRNDNQIELLSKAPDGSLGNGNSSDAVISADGRYVIFSSLATNLAAGDTNGKEDIFVYDRQTLEITRISVLPDGTQPNGNSRSPAISGDGSIVGFDSDAGNLVSGDTNGVWDVFVTYINNSPSTPAINIVEPDGINDTADQTYTITWTDSDPDDNAAISLYYDTNNNGADGTLIIGGLTEDSTTDSYTWDTSSLPAGDYYIYGVIDDGVNEAVVDYSQGVVTIEHSTLNNGLEAYYPFDNDIIDASGNNYNGRITGSLSYEPGVVGQAVRFDGSSYILIDNLYFPIGTGTISLWAKVDSNSSPGSLLDSKTNYRSAFYHDSNEFCIGYPRVPLVTDQWKFYTFVYQNGTSSSGIRQSYVNGVLAATDTGYVNNFQIPWEGTIDAESAIGITIWNANIFKGVIDDIRIYNRVLTDTEIQTLYGLGSIPPLDPLDTDDDNDGYTENQGDCRDDNETIYPGAPEIRGDGIDQDCNGEDLSCLEPNYLNQIEQKILASVSDPESSFGKGISISGNYAIVGTWGDSENGWNAGAAYIFERSGDTFIEVAKLTASDGAAWDQFGYSVSISGDYSVVGAWRDADNGEMSGSAYVFERINGVWTQVAKLVPVDGSEQDRFGGSVSISGNYIIIGAYGNSDLVSYSGAAYVFERINGVWSQVSKLTANDPSAGYFGYAVSISGDYAVSTAISENPRAAAYVFKRENGVWTKTQKLMSNLTSDNFGESVMISDNRIVIGANYGLETNYKGSAYVFERNGETWTSTYISTNDCAAYDYFGTSVAIYGNHIFIGAPGDDDHGETSGSIYIFEYNNLNWKQISKVTSINSKANDNYGYFLAANGDSLLVSSYANDENGINAGAVYTYKLDCFDNTPPITITVTSPNGGEYLEAGSSQNITWTTEGLTGNVTIDLYKDGILNSNIGTADVHSSPFPWTINPNQEACSDYTVKIYQGTVEDFSDNPFTISPPPIEEPEINITHGTTEIPDGGTFNFGDVSVGNSIDEIFTIENTGNADLILSNLPITITGNNADRFSIIQQPATPINPSGTSTFIIRFTPSSEGAQTASISIGNNDSDEAPYDTILNGTGTENIIPAIERSALIALYESTDGNNWTNNSGWKTGPIHPDGFAMPGTEGTWFGITLTNNMGENHVTQIELSNNNLSGNIPVEIGNFSYLTTIILFDNKLSGSIPAGLGNLSNLKNFDLGLNPFDPGPIPGGITNLSQLERIRLDSINLNGPIPPELGQLSHLISLNLSNNSLTGNIPVELSNLVNLEELLLYSNNLEGSIPDELANLSKLKKLDLESNQLSDNFPGWVVNLTDLWNLNLGGCGLTGSIPIEIGNLTNLITLILSNNQLTGTIPPEIGNLSGLNYLSLSNNNLSGSIPTEFENLHNLQILYLHSNQLSGNIPIALRSLSYLTHLYLGDNRFSGNLPEELGNLYHLKDLTLQSNMFIGEIPNSFTNLVELSHLDMGYNALHTDDINLRAFLDEKDPDWESTQTIAPTNISGAALANGLLEVSWTPITYTGDSGEYRVHYGTDNGGPYPDSVATSDKTLSSIIITGLEPATTYYFVVSTRTGSHDKNQNTVDSEFSDEASATTLLIPGITVISPNGGENLTGGSNHAITWTSTGIGNSIIIEYSTDKGNSWLNIASAASNTGSYTWKVPDNSSDNCLIRISSGDSDDAPSDVSDSAFSIVSPPEPTLKMISPNGGERIMVGSTYPITWAGNGAGGDVKIEYSIDNGFSWITIVPYTNNDGSYLWAIPDTPSENCLVRIGESDKDTGISDVSDGGFSIVAAPFITITSPNGGESWEGGTTHPITWTSTGVTGNVKIEFSINNGTSWTTIAASAVNNGSFNWTVPGTQAENCLVRVSESDGSPFDVSNAVFSIVPAPFLTVTSPNGDENWNAGSTHNITWTGSGAGNKVTIEYSTDNGVTWKSIGSSLDNNGSYPWTLPGNPSDNCLVRISTSNADRELSDTSDAKFSIVPAPVITVTSPNGGERLSAGTTHDITWTCNGTVGEVKIEYSLDNGGQWTTIVPSTANDGSHSWTVPENPSKTCRVRISETDGEPADISDGVFSIVTPPTATLTVTSPNGGEQLTTGTTHNITWSSTGMQADDSVIIHYSIDNGGTWTTIEPSTRNTGSFPWAVPDSPAENCLIRLIAGDSDDGPSDVSDEVFAIVESSTPTITVTSPNGDETLTSGTSHEITWTATGMEKVENIIIEYSNNNGTSWTAIAFTTSDVGSLNWTVPDEPSENCLLRIRVSDVDEGPADVSDEVFSIISAPTLKVTSPNGGEQCKTGSSYNITWTYEQVNGDIVIDLYRGSSFDLNIGTAAVETGSFNWTIPVNFTLGNDYKILLHKDTTEDYSDAEFTIIDREPNQPDFNNDGHVDILWRNYATGNNEVWLMNGSQHTSTVELPVQPDLNWRIVGTGDFNRDGKADILWRNYSNGQNLVWYMDGTTQTGIAYLLDRTDMNWQIVSAGDFNGDGRVDILWRNPLEARDQVWLLDGIDVKEYKGLPSLEGISMRIAGIGDFNGDNQTDILWRNYSTGSNEVWFMNGTTRISTAALLEMSDATWRIVGTGDFNRDGERDILWRSNFDGKNMIWYMDGTIRTGYEYIETRSDLNWRIVGNGDYRE